MSRCPTGVQKLTFFELIADDDSNLEYGAPYSFDKSLIAVKVTPAVITAGLDADDQEVETDAMINGGSVEITLSHITAEERAMLYGHTVQGGVTMESAGDSAPYFCVAFQSTRRGNDAILKKIYKCKFTPGEESAQTARRDGISYQTSTIRGRYSPLLNNAVARGMVDDTSDKYDQLADEWFASGWNTLP